VSQESLLKFLDGLGNKVMLDSPDCSFDWLSKDLALVSTTDFFYPLVDDPFQQGRIGAANVLSDLFAAGVTEIRNSLMILGVSTKMSKDEQQLVTSQMIAGYAQAVEDTGAKVTGGQTVFNEWPIIGGTAIGVVRGENPYTPRNAKAGDILVLTKPLGSQIIVNVNQYLKNKDEKYNVLFKEKKLVSESTFLDTYLRGVETMGRLNKTAAELMLALRATSSTDVTGFGILGHAENLVTIQRENVDYVIDFLPVYKGMPQCDNIVRDFNVIKGRTPETSGGLLISLPPETVPAFIKGMIKSNEEAWIVGRVVEGTRKARLSENVEIMEV